MADTSIFRGFAAALAALSLVVSPLAFAAPSGGGGGSGDMGGSGGAGVSGRQIDPDEAYRDGVAALSTRDYRAAIRHFRDVLNVAPRHTESNYALGVAYIGNGEARRARRPLERAVEGESAPPDAYLQLGLVYLEIEERTLAEAQLSDVAARLAACAAPACSDQRRAQLQSAHDGLAAALAPASAEEAAPEATSWNFPDSDDGRAAYGQAVGLINQARYGEALDALARASAAVGPHADVLNYQGFASRKLGRYDSALAYYNQALAIDPNHLGAHEYLGELYLELGRIGDARRQLARLDQLCAFGCAEREELARWIAQSAEN